MANTQYQDEYGNIIDEDPYFNDWDTDPWDDAGYTETPVAGAPVPTGGGEDVPAPPDAPPPPTGDPYVPPGGGGGGGYDGGGNEVGGGGLITPYPRTFARPTQDQIRGAVTDALGLLPARPEFTPPEIPQIAPWQAPSEADVYADPSFKLRKGIGEQALMNNRAAQGLVRTGGTLKDLLGYNQNFASQEYGNIANRSLEGWRGNTAATLQRAGLDQDRAKSMYEPQFAEYQNKVATATRVPELEYDRSWREFLADYDIWRDQRDHATDSLFDLSEMGIG